MKMTMNLKRTLNEYSGEIRATGNAFLKNEVNGKKYQSHVILPYL